MSFPYRIDSRSKDFPDPAPIVVMIAAHSALSSICFSVARSTLRILPRNGSSAWYSELRAPFNVPPAESPSIRNSSHSSMSSERQSASLAGIEDVSNAFLRRIVSFWRRMALRVLAA